MSEIKSIEKAGLVRRADAVQLLWGDDICGYVPDILHVSSQQMDLLGFRMPPGASYTASEKSRAIYRTDVIFYVLQGQLTVQIPETGEVAVAEEGEALLLPKRKFHFGYNFSDRELQVLEAIVKVPPLPTPYTGTFPVPGLGLDVDGLRDFPRARQKGKSEILVVGKATAKNVVIGLRQKILLRVLASCELVSAAVFDLQAGQRSESIRCAKDATLYLEKGRAHVRIASEQLWDELNPEDAFFLPAGCEWQVFNYGGEGASFHLALAGNLATDMTLV